MTDDARTVPCVGCGALVPDTDGPTHRYVGASPGCWALLNEVQLRGYDDARFSIGQLGVDAYMAQHPGVPSPQSIQSVTVHLIGLNLQLERGVSGAISQRALVQAERYKTQFTWLTPPASRGDVTIVAVRAIQDPALLSPTVRRWADAVWHAWAPHHAIIHAWVTRLG